MKTYEDPNQKSPMGIKRCYKRIMDKDGQLIIPIWNYFECHGHGSSGYNDSKCSTRTLYFDTLDGFPVQSLESCYTCEDCVEYNSGIIEVIDSISDFTSIQLEIHGDPTLPRLSLIKLYDLELSEITAHIYTI